MAQKLPVSQEKFLNVFTNDAQIVSKYVRIKCNVVTVSIQIVRHYIEYSSEMVNID